MFAGGRTHSAEAIPIVCTPMSLRRMAPPPPPPDMVTCTPPPPPPPRRISSSKRNGCSGGCAQGSMQRPGSFLRGSFLRFWRGDLAAVKVCGEPPTAGRGGGGLVPSQFGSGKCGCGKSPRRGLLDQAQVRTPYTPPFWGHSRTIPQGMVPDVQPLVKSSF